VNERERGAIQRKGDRAKRREGERTPDPVGRESRRAEGPVLLPDLSAPDLSRAERMASPRMSLDSNVGFAKMLGNAMSTERLKSGAGSTFGESNP
jgi:hypothetical protein